MPLFYFDFKGEVPVRDHKGELCAAPDDAIRRGDERAKKLAADRPDFVGKNYYVSVLDMSGTEIHRAPLG